MIVISGAGLATSLGGLASACAAHRAGIDHLRPLGIGLPNPGQDEPSAIKGHCVAAVEGMEDYGRLIALLVLALRDALGPDALMLSDPRTRVLIVLPNEEERASLAIIEDDDISLGADALVIDQLCSVMGAVPHLQATIVRAGHDGVLTLLAKAQQDISSGACDRVIVCAADSLVDPHTALTLASSGVLRHEALADGFFPGEAGAALILEGESAAIAQSKTVLARIVAIECAPAPEPDESETATPHGNNAAARAIPGQALRNALLRLDGTARPDLQQLTGILDDQNGESKRAHYLWYNLLRGGADSPSFGRLSLLPRCSTAEAFGDVGAATGALQICVALRAFARGHWLGQSLLVCNTSDKGAAAALILTAPRSS